MNGQEPEDREYDDDLMRTDDDDGCDTDVPAHYWDAPEDIDEPITANPYDMSHEPY